MAYCAPTDLLVGDTRLPSNVSPTAYINAAADEIDGAIGYLYVTPIVVDSNAVNRPTQLLLKTINSWLATGRIILTISRSGEDNTLDALGKYYVNMALSRINDIANGKIDLLGANKTNEGPKFKGPTIKNAEEVSLVDAFYSNYNHGDPAYFKDFFAPRTQRPGPTV